LPSGPMTRFPPSFSAFSNAAATLGTPT
jgi:hypothetical protein